MKVRIQGNSIRFRLKQFEVESFKETGIVKEVTSFGNLDQDQLQFALCSWDEPSFSIQKDGAAIRLFVPRVVADEWTGTERVGFQEQVRTSAGTEIAVLVEKDFKCLDGNEEEGSYPNPMKEC